MKKTVVPFLFATILTLVTISSAKTELKFGWWVDVSTGQGKLARYAADGMNFMHINGATYYSPAQINAFLDEAASLGIEASISLTRTQHCSYPWTAAQIQNFVNAIKHHPAVWGWYIADEPELGPSAVYTYLSSNPGYYHAVKAADPDHPVWLVFSGRAHSAWNDVTDAIGINVYPSYGAAEFENSQLRLAYDYWKNGYDFANTYGKSPFLAVCQGFGAGHGLWDDMSVVEERYHVFTAVVLGIQRILFWSEQWAKTDTNSSHTFSMVAQMMRELSSMKFEMANGTTNDPRILVNQPTTNLVYRYGVNGNRHVILAVNIANRNSTSGQALSNVRFTLPSGIRPSQVEVLNENRTLPVIDGVFTDSFSRFGVHAYSFVTGTAGSLSPPTGLRVVQ